jgi:mono/diheme cytochrome c family protein
MIPVGAFLFMLILGCGNGQPSSGPPGAPSMAEATGEKVYNTHCTLCHGKDGALGLSGAKDLRVSTATREEMIEQVTNGRGAMMAYKNVLTKAEIEAVVDHVRTLAATE